MDSSTAANPNIHTIVKAQIVFLLSTLTEENFERNQVEIRSIRLFCLACFWSPFFVRRVDVLRVHAPCL